VTDRTGQDKTGRSLGEISMFRQNAFVSSKLRRETRLAISIAREGIWIWSIDNRKSKSRVSLSKNGFDNKTMLVRLGDLSDCL